MPSSTRVSCDESIASAPDAGASAPNTRRQAYSELIRQVEGVLLRAAWRYCPGQHDYAQDLVQETLVRGYEAFLDGRFEEGTNARAWLLTILTHCYFTDIRRQRRWFADVDMDALVTEGAHQIVTLRAAERDQPDRALLATTLDEPMERALAGLPASLRVCVILVDIEELSYA